MAAAAAVLAKEKVVTSKLVPPNTCHCPSEAALKCQLMMNRDGGWGVPEATETSEPGTEIPGHCPLSATTYTVVTAAAQESDGLTQCLFARGTSSTAAATQLTWLDWKEAALAYDLITVSFLKTVSSQQGPSHAASGIRALWSKQPSFSHAPFLVCSPTGIHSHTCSWF